MNATRDALLACYRQALIPLHGRQRVNAFLTHHAVGDHHPPQYIVAVGKAAAEMAMGAVDFYGEHIRAGLVITKRGYLSKDNALPEIIECHEAAHPLPDESSLAAGVRLTQFVEQLPSDSHLLFLLSGGASSLVECLQPGISPVQLHQMNQWLLASGWDIAHINRLRIGISQIKGGGLLRKVASRQVTQLMMSDVQGDDSAVIGSGLLSGRRSPLGEDVIAALPVWIQKCLHALPTRTQASNQVLTKLQSHIICNNAFALDVLAGLCAKHWSKVIVHEESLFMDVTQAAESIVNTLINSESDTVLLWGGETTVVLPENAGAGGRNQHLALLVAQRLHVLKQGYFLAGATDGSDGNTLYSGAIVDANTVMRASQKGQMNIKTAINMVAATDYLLKSDDLITTGPTGSNVMDVMIAVK